MRIWAGFRARGNEASRRERSQAGGGHTQTHTQHTPSRASYKGPTWGIFPAPGRQGAGAQAWPGDGRAHSFCRAEGGAREGEREGKGERELP